MQAQRACAGFCRPLHFDGGQLRQRNLRLAAGDRHAQTVARQAGAVPFDIEEFPFAGALAEHRARPSDPVRDFPEGARHLVESGWGAAAALAATVGSCDPTALPNVRSRLMWSGSQTAKSCAIFGPCLRFPRNPYFASAGLAASAGVASFRLASDSFTRLVKSPASLCSNPL